jgi:hypothetical protein
LRATLRSSRQARISSRSSASVSGRHRFFAFAGARPLVRRELRRTPHFDAPRHGPRPAFAGARPDKVALELRETA